MKLTGYSKKSFKDDDSDTWEIWRPLISDSYEVIDVIVNNLEEPAWTQIDENIKSEVLLRLKKALS